MFAPLVLVAHLVGANPGVVESAAAAYFRARVVHAVVYACAIPWARTLAFTLAVAAQRVIAVQVLVR